MRALLKDPAEVAITYREREIIALIALGYSNWEIATILFISQETVKSHIRRSLAKMKARTRSELVYRAIQHSILSVTNLPEKIVVPSRMYVKTYEEEWNGEPDELLRILSKD